MFNFRAVQKVRFQMHSKSCKQRRKPCFNLTVIKHKTETKNCSDKVRRALLEETLLADPSDKCPETAHLSERTLRHTLSLTSTQILVPAAAA